MYDQTMSNCPCMADDYDYAHVWHMTMTMTSPCTDDSCLMNTKLYSLYNHLHQTCLIRQMQARNKEKKKKYSSCAYLQCSLSEYC